MVEVVEVVEVVGQIQAREQVHGAEAWAEAGAGSVTKTGAEAVAGCTWKGHRHGS